MVGQLSVEKPIKILNTERDIINFIKGIPNNKNLEFQSKTVLINLDRFKQKHNAQSVIQYIATQSRKRDIDIIYLSSDHYQLPTFLKTTITGKFRLLFDRLHII